ncbi:fusion product of 3-hydroxacyl-CoA dehydrogenase andacyl-CoA-binding protein [Moritella sp. PE36]|uniref:acyl-CoA-binding protein n=1 Tax=Moritella sp. PE36 TaxID=58051 RepID=UPI00015681E2|nr:acyl-CoA-binding protein [Moritella sp. PE36]EDM68615.1 fusion product of 3-hydroxacyl-CoA dehydrogenase andacyl-CoA-binding protein [Moritella sp. PE36]
MTDLRAKFDATVDQVQNGTAKKKPSQEVKLEFYSLFKQATEGDVAAKKPSIFDMVAFAKWTAWNKLRGLSSDQAMEKYIALVEEENAA